MEIPGLGRMTKDQFDWYISDPIRVPVLGGQTRRIVVAGYEDDTGQDDFHTAIKNFLSIDDSALRDAEAHVYAYYKECNAHWTRADDEYVLIESPRDVWAHVQFGTEPIVERRGCGDQGVYVSLTCGCDWEEEHGLQIVLKNGLKVKQGRAVRRLAHELRCLRRRKPGGRGLSVYR